MRLSELDGSVPRAQLQALVSFSVVGACDSQQTPWHDALPGSQVTSEDALAPCGSNNYYIAQYRLVRSLSEPMIFEVFDALVVDYETRSAYPIETRQVSTWPVLPGAIRPLMATCVCKTNSRLRKRAIVCAMDFAGLLF